MIEKCETCFFWKTSGCIRSVTHGECHRYPPSHLSQTIIAKIPPYDPLILVPQWVETNAYDFCGEWKENPRVICQNGTDSSSSGCVADSAAPAGS